MVLTSLPTEIIDNIIPYTLPEGFENLALTCRKVYALCTPFIEYHNQLRWRFREFGYFRIKSNPSFSLTTAWDLIIRIAIEPVVARYIRIAHFKLDSYRRGPHDMLLDITDPHCGEAVLKLLSSSCHLEQAGLGWKEFYAKIEEDLEEMRYSQHAAAFLLTLLPNINTLTLPMSWKPIDATDKLLDVIVREAKRSHLPWDRPALARVTRFEDRPYSDHRTRFGEVDPNVRCDLSKAVPFLALPHMRLFFGTGCVAMGDAFIEITSKEPYRGYGEALEAVNLAGCCMDEAAITDFLKHTPRLKKLIYSHTSKEDGNHQDWDICKFVTVIEREAGSSLEELSVSIDELHNSIAPGKASMRGFQCLRKLEFPLEIAMCNITFATSIDHALDYSEPFISDLVPASVSQLALLSKGQNNHEKALDVMFRHFAAKKDSQLPALKEINLSCPTHPSASDAYKEQFAKLVTETEKVGVVLQVHPCGFSIIPSGW